MNNFKFTGVNIAAALLIVAFFFTWVSGEGVFSYSGFELVRMGISPGMAGGLLSGFTRVLLLLIILVPLAGALILYQNVTGNQKFKQYYRPAHFLPTIILVGGMIVSYFKIEDSKKGFMGEMMPGLFDILGAGVFLSLIAAVYLLFVSMGKVKDKEYFKPGSSNAAASKSGVDNTTNSSDSI